MNMNIDTEKKQHSYHFLLLALSVSCVVVYFIIKPFLGPLILAAVFAFLFQPIYKKILSFFRQRESLSAFVTTILSVLLIMIPVTFLGFQIFKESSQLYHSLAISSDSSFIKLSENVVNQIRDFSPLTKNFDFNFNQYARQGLEMLIQNIGKIFSSLAKILINLLFFLIAFYFFLKDGHKLKNYFVLLSPLADYDDELVVSRLKLAVSAVIRGNLTIGIIQGILTGIGFAIFGVPNPSLWGVVAILAAFLPGIGTALVLTPAIIFLFMTGSTFGGFGLLIWGIIAVGLVDNFLAPKLVGHGMKLHPLAVFIAILGGLAFFGPLGFLLGPIFMSICLVLIEIYFSFKKRSHIE